MNRLLNTPFPELSTERLILRRLVPEDDKAIARLRSDERVNRYLERPPTTNLKEAGHFIEKINASIENRESFYWAITLKEEQALLGTICYWNLEPENDRAEIGYELHPDAQGQGIMQEAITCVIQFGFEQLKLNSITACSRSDNLKSVRLLEKNKFTIAAGVQTDEGCLFYVLYVNDFQQLLS